jgi:putative heme-binding domain-containing protein
MSLADEESRARLETALRSLPPVDASRTELIAERRRAYDASPGDPAIGARLYEQNCAVCHQLNGQGGLVGPQLTGIGNRGAERLCEDILDPNQNVDHAFRQTRIELRNGDTLAGLFRREEGDLLVFADATGKEFSVRKGDVAEREESSMSLMPDNFSDVLPTAEFSHLLAFLLSQR